MAQKINLVYKIKKFYKTMKTLFEIFQENVYIYFKKFVYLVSIVTKLKCLKSDNQSLVINLL
jgi:hypothetical protein